MDLTGSTSSAESICNATDLVSTFKHCRSDMRFSGANGHCLEQLGHVLTVVHAQVSVFVWGSDHYLLRQERGKEWALYYSRALTVGLVESCSRTPAYSVDPWIGSRSDVYLPM